MAWGVGIEGCAEVGGARVPASERVLDVGRSGVVVKLGLGEGAQKGVVVVVGDVGGT